MKLKDEQLVRGHADKDTLKAGENLENFSNESSSMIQLNPDLLSILQNVCLPRKKANYPTRVERTMLRRSQTLLEAEPLGSVIALPGQGDTSLLSYSP